MHFLISDTHFGHKNIIEYENRPFESVEEMDETMIRNWNSVVGMNDTVWHLGDFALCGAERTREIIHSLNGRIKLLKGNHDRHSVGWWEREGVELIKGRGIWIGDYILLTHSPVTGTLNPRLVNFHGHIHNKKADMRYNINVCVERNMMHYVPLMAPFQGCLAYKVV